MKDIESRVDIEYLVHSFYERAINDDTIGYIFTDVAQLNLASHLPKICDFWEGILLGKMKYKGNPMLKHLALSKKETLTPQHFARWLTLWNATLQASFAGMKATMASQKANMLADLMMHKIAQLDKQ